MFILAQTALASETFRTTDGVNFRTGPSTDDEVISVVYPRVNVEVLEHDPAGWSMVRIDGTVGFIRSDFLMFPIGNTPATFRTTDGVNFRTGPSTDASIINTVLHGTSVDVLEHDPAGWSRVRIDGTTGFIRSDFLTKPIQVAAQPATSTAQTTMVLFTSGDVRFRAGPSTDTNVIRVLSPGTAVNVISQGANGWTRGTVNGTTGYIRSDLLRTSNQNIEFLNWSEARNLIRNGVPMRVTDVRTGLSFNLQSFSKSGHADVEPLTQADTDTILRTRNGVWSWSARPVWVTIGNRTIAAALNGMPHAGSTISGNGMNGHLCLHFGGTVTNSKSYQANLRAAVQEAFDAAR